MTPRFCSETNHAHSGERAGGGHPLSWMAVGGGGAGCAYGRGITTLRPNKSDPHQQIKHTKRTNRPFNRTDQTDKHADKTTETNTNENKANKPPIKRLHYSVKKDTKCTCRQNERNTTKTQKNDKTQTHERKQTNEQTEHKHKIKLLSDK